MSSALTVPEQAVGNCVGWIGGCNGIPSYRAETGKPDCAETFACPYSCN